MVKAMTRVLVSTIAALVICNNCAAFAAERTVTLAVDNMYCDACPYIVQQTLAAIPGVEDVTVSFEQKSATITYDDSKASPDALISATTEAGYPSRVIP